MKLVVIFLFACMGAVSKAADAAKVINFEECIASANAAAYTEYGSSSSLIEFNTGGTVGGKFNWNFCAMHAVALQHVQDVQITLSEAHGGASILSRSVKVCPNPGICRSQLAQGSKPSCIHGSTLVPWLVEPKVQYNASLSLREPDGVVVAKFCTPYSSQ